MMAKPIKPKSLKPKASGSAKPDEAAAAASPNKSNPSPNSARAKGITMFQTIILAVVMLVASVVGPALTLYLLGPTVIGPMIEKAMPHEGEAGEENAEEGGHGETGHHGAAGGHGPVAHAPGLGMNLALEDFTTNLHRGENAKGNQFLRAKMSLAIQVPEAEDCHALAAHGDDHGGGGGGHGGGAPVDPMEACQTDFQKKMQVYTPTLRDIINTALMKRSANELSTLEGQEELKDELVNEMNAVLKNHGYSVLRVNLQDFIIQR